MGIFNEQESNSFAKGIQGAPGIGFNLTSDGDYDMINRKLRNVGTPNLDTDAATKKYVDDNSTGTPSTTRLRVDSNIDMKDTYRILNLSSPNDSDEPATKKYSDDNFIKIDGSNSMSGDLNLNNKKVINLGPPTSNTDAATKKYVDDNSTGSQTSSKLTVDSNIDMKDRYRILNLKSPLDADEPATKQYADSSYLPRDGSRTMLNDLSMNNNKITNVKTPTNNNDVATKKYVDDNSGSSGSGASTTSRLTIDSDIDMKNTYRLKNLRTPLDSKEAVTKYYVDNTFLDRDGSYPMKGDLNMDNYKILNIQNPTGPKQPTPLAFTDIKYLHVGGTNKMLNQLNMNNKKIVNLRTPFNDTDAATKKYVDDNSIGSSLNNYLKRDGTSSMLGHLDLNNKKIINLSKPTQDNDAVNKDYVDKLTHHVSVQPSHYANQFHFLMSNASQWTDEIDTGTSFVIDKIADLLPSKGNFHTYNHKVIYVKINKNSQGGYKYKMSVNFYRLTANVEYTLCLEILNTEYELWHKSQISVDRGGSTGLSIENVSVKKLSHTYTDAANATQYMYYHRIIVNFKKLTTGNKFFLHFLVNIPQEGTDLSVYPNQFSGVYFVTYGIIGKVANIDPDKVYDYHTAFDIKPTEVTYNVSINANNKKIINVQGDKTDNDSAATVGIVKEYNTELAAIVNLNLPFIKNYIYRKNFEHFFDFTDSNNYLLNKQSSGVVFNGLSSITGNSAQNITFPNKTIDDIKEAGLRINNYTISFKPPSKNTSYTICIVFSHLRTNNFRLTQYDVTSAKRQLLFLYYLHINDSLNLDVGNQRKSMTVLSSYSGKKVALWLTVSNNDNLTKLNLSNYPSTLVANISRNSVNNQFDLYFQDSVIEKFMYTPKFYDIDNVEFHEIMLQEKLNGTYIT